MMKISRTDVDIQADVMEELKWDMRVRSNEIGVSVKDSIVTLLTLRYKGCGEEEKVIG
ncbi:MAG: BON domain-containing protein [Chloroflexota bacterium]|nr:BON domain-containing protein [Chloroflexota bacterium]